MQTFDTQSQHRQTLSQNGRETNGNSINPSLALSLVTAIKADLEQVNPETMEKVLQLENWIKDLQASQANVAVASQKDCKHEREWLSTVATRMRQAGNIDDVFRTLLIELRQYLHVDRALIYRFESEKQGTVIAESILFGYTPSQSLTLAAIAFGVDNQSSYQKHQVIAQNHAEQTEPNHYQLQLLQNFQVKTSLSIPIRLEEQVWGLLVVHQCKSDREWQEAEISLLYQIVTELTLVLQTREFRAQMQKQVDLAQYLSKAIDKIRSSWNLNTIFKTTVKEVRQLLNADRVGVFRFEPGTNFNDGAMIVEDVALGYHSMLNIKIHEHCFGQDFASQYAQGRVQVIADIQDGTLKNCHVELLAQFQIRANLVVPLLKGNELWGLLCVHKCTEPRQWQVFEIESVKQIAALFSSAFYLGMWI
ncbi:MAG: GAF domain-containing protein [Rhizonema sp. NSF051]|nr:GAF domain-containing protein [Rhizonema sp. NSF051]